MAAQADDTWRTKTGWQLVSDLRIRPSSPHPLLVALQQSDHEKKLTRTPQTEEGNTSDPIGVDGWTGAERSDGKV